ncbi:ParA family protein [Glutamicibacter arilaitensis]|uniref:ParA family protein n=1 Tax=Glutamicibacter arilaitensis TaxID=256701 RepID=UPI003FD239BF
MHVVCLGNEKGGVGKTTCTINLAHSASQQGKRVLVIDLDPQGNLTSAISAEELAEDSCGIADVITPDDPMTLVEVIVPTTWEGVDLAPTPLDLPLKTVLNQLTIMQFGSESRLREALSLVEDRYDLVLIDCPPASNKLTINAMTAANQVVVVTEPAFWSIKGISMILQSMAMVQKYVNPQLEFAGILVNKYNKQLLNHAEYLQQIKEHGGDLGVKVFDPAIPVLAAIEGGGAEGLSLHDHKLERVRTVAKNYDRFVRELMEEGN